MFFKNTLGTRNLVNQIQRNFQKKTQQNLMQRQNQHYKKQLMKNLSYQCKKLFAVKNLDGFHINQENMDYFNIDMNIFQQTNLKYKNPQEGRCKKLLKDVKYKQDNTTLAYLADKFDADIEMVKRSAKLIGIQHEDNEYHQVTFDEAEVLSYEYNCKLIPEDFDSKYQQETRPPVITIMGHVDHGKTTLLDTLRESNVCDGEFGGITQKIGAFHNISQDGIRTTYIDTPGHEAFVNMRIRGASSTDLIVLVVSAIEGIQPQTLEVISIAQSNNLPLLVVVNKIDVDGANPQEVEDQLYHKGGLHLETHGGNIPVLHISAKKNINIDFLKELILFETELLELKSTKKCQAEGIVLESRKCPETQQQSCTVIVQRGTLKVGDWLIIGDEYQKVRQLKDDRNSLLKEAYPSYAVEITGLKNIVNSGDLCFVVDSENKAKLVSQRRKWAKQQKEGQTKQISGSASKIKFQSRRERRKFHSGNKELVKEKFDQIEQKLLFQINELEEIQSTRELKEFEMDQLVRLNVDLETHKEYVAQMINESEINENAINIIIKAVDQGTKETIVAQIYQLVSKFQDVEFNLISSGVGAITENDIRDASFANASIIAMDVNAQPDAVKLAKKEGVQISTHRIIYSILDDMKKMLNQAHSSDKVQLVQIGSGTCKNVFKVKAGKGKNSQRVVAGMAVQKGTFNKKHIYAIRRGDEVIAERLEIANLKHFKNEVNEIKKGEECGIIFFDHSDIQPGDIIESYEMNDYESNIQ